MRYLLLMLTWDEVPPAGYPLLGPPAGYPLLGLPAGYSCSSG